MSAGGEGRRYLSASSGLDDDDARLVAGSISGGRFGALEIADLEDGAGVHLVQQRHISSPAALDDHLHDTASLVPGILSIPLPCFARAAASAVEEVGAEPAHDVVGRLEVRSVPDDLLERDPVALVLGRFLFLSLGRKQVGNQQAGEQQESSRNASRHTSPPDSEVLSA
jgi:hypothetical protein